MVKMSQKLSSWMHPWIIMPGIQKPFMYQRHFVENEEENI